MTAGADRPMVQRGVERVQASCETCKRSWTGAGRKRSQRAVDAAQAHTNLTGHLVSVAWTNRP